MLAGLVVGVVPGVEEIRLPPDVVFFGFLPPLLYAAAFLTAPREVRENWLSILVLAVGLTAATLFAVGGVAWAFVGALGAGGAFLLGAVLGPTDPVSATSVIGATSAPERLRTILEGESLVNDGVGLVAFSIALTAVRARKLLRHRRAPRVRASLDRRHCVRPRTCVRARARPPAHPRPADRDRRVARHSLPRLHPGGATAPLGHPRHRCLRRLLRLALRGIFRPEVRLQSVAFWDVLTFMLASVLFVLLGTQFRAVVSGLDRYSAGTLARDALVVFGTVTVVRMAWMFTVPHLVSGLTRRGWSDIEPWQDRFVLGWSGMRGALSLAAALSIPATVAHRDEILYLTFTTILAGLVVLAVPLPWLLDRLGFGVVDAKEPQVELSPR